MAWQVVEKDSYGTDWAMVRYGANALVRFETEEAAMAEAKKYLTDRNSNNALTKTEKRSNIEAFMMTDEGCLLGVLDGQDWYLDYPKDIKIKDNSPDGYHILPKGSNVADEKYYELEGKTVVKVRPVPGT